MPGPLFSFAQQSTGALLLSAPMAAFVVISIAVFGNVSHADETQGRPNFVLIMADDAGYSDIGCYGGEIKTPTLDRLADSGLRFSQFYNTARCCPTRASLLSGLYPHQAGVGHMVATDHVAHGNEAYQGDLNRQCQTIAEVLGPAGYATYMSGKWHIVKHVDKDGPKDNWPQQRGFDKFYGTITGAGSFYDPTTLCRGNRYITPDNDPEYQSETFYYTDAIGDNAVKYLQTHGQENAHKPFFLYVAFTSPHWPMHALEEDIEKYHGVYDRGYAPIRKARLQRLQKMGLIHPDWKMSKQVGNWQNVKNRDWEIRCMEVYAAMIDRMDQNIGKIVDQLESSGQLDNTVVFYLQDNGGCAEGMGRNSNRRGIPENIKPFGPDELQPFIWPPMQTRDGRPVRTGPDVMPGPADTYIAYGKNWANVSNTPFREYKHWVHEGGISTPLIVHWPAGIKTNMRGKLDHSPSHLIDIMSTCVDLSGAEYPAKVGKDLILPLEGTSLRPAFSGESIARENPIFWEHEANGAVRDGKWKIVRYGNQRTGKTQPWELYDMENDRTEQNNLAETHPDVLKRLEAHWDAWAVRAAVVPWPWGENAKRTKN